MRLQDLYLPAAVVNGIAAMLCVVTAVAANLPWVAAIGVSANLAALVLLVLVGELLE